MENTTGTMQSVIITIELDFQNMRNTLNEIFKEITVYKPAKLSLTSVNTVINLIQLVQSFLCPLNHPLPNSTSSRIDIIMMETEMTKVLRSFITQGKKRNPLETIHADFTIVSQKLKTFEDKIMSLLHTMNTRLPTGDLSQTKHLLLLLQKLSWFHCPLKNNIYLKSSIEDLDFLFAPIHLHIYNLTIAVHSANKQEEILLN